jgi:small subunit ribosomal protein S7e
MFNKSKLQIKGDRNPTELEEECGKTLQALEKTQEGDVARSLRFIYVSGAEEVEYEQADGTHGKYIILRIPFRSLQYFKKVSSQVVEHLEEKFKWHVFVVANRTIQSKRAHTHPSQMRPRSRTLKAVHKEFMADIVVPSSIVGRRVHVTTQGEMQEKIYLDPLDRGLVADKLDAMAHAYAKLTTHKIALEFAKPTSFQKKTLEKLRERQQK